jgi:hypothetical protein
LLQQADASSNPYQNVTFSNGYPSPIETPICELPGSELQAFYPASPQNNGVGKDHYFDAQSSQHHQQKPSQGSNFHQQAIVESRPPTTATPSSPQHGNQSASIMYGSLASIATPNPFTTGSQTQQQVPVGLQDMRMDIKSQELPQSQVPGRISHTRSFDSTVTASSNASMWSAALSPQTTALTASSSGSIRSRPDMSGTHQPTLTRSMTEGSSLSTASSHLPTCHHCKSGKKNTHFGEHIIHCYIQVLQQPCVHLNV